MYKDKRGRIIIVNQLKFNHQYIKTYYDLYNEIYYDRFCNIDVALKTELAALSIQKVSELLFIDEKEVAEILSEIHATKINLSTFIYIMMRGSSGLCQLFYRQITTGNKKVYSLKELSYIYKLKDCVLLDAAVSYGKEEIPAEELREFFKYVKLTGALYSFMMT